jgi:plastocyanin
MFTSRLIAAAAVSLLGLSPTAAVQGPMGMPIVAIEMHSYSYNPSPIHLTAGQPVMLQFVNRSGKGHDFTAREFFAASRILSGRVEDGEVEVAPGRAKALKLIPAAGTYKVHCGHPFHAILGMKSTIIVR